MHTDLNIHTHVAQLGTHFTGKQTKIHTTSCDYAGMIQEISPVLNDSTHNLVFQLKGNNGGLSNFKKTMYQRHEHRTDSKKKIQIKEKLRITLTDVITYRNC